MLALMVRHLIIHQHCPHNALLPSLPVASEQILNFKELYVTQEPVLQTIGLGSRGK